MVTIKLILLSCNRGNFKAIFDIKGKADNLINHCMYFKMQSKALHLKSEKERVWDLVGWCYESFAALEMCYTNASSSRGRPAKCLIVLICASHVYDAAGRKAPTPQHRATELTSLTTTPVSVTLCTLSLWTQVCHQFCTLEPSEAIKWFPH